MMDWPALVPPALGKLRILRVRFDLEAETEARLPDYLGSTLRGALAMATKRMVCTYSLRPCDGCPVQHSCLYPASFETPTATGTQSVRRMRDFPHPILIEPPSHHARHYQMGEGFSFDLIFLGSAAVKLPYLIFAVQEMASEGLGMDRHRFTLRSVLNRDGFPIYDAESGQILNHSKPITVEELTKAIPICSRVCLELKTPLRLKAKGSLITRTLDMKEFLQYAGRRLWAVLTSYENASKEAADFRPLLEHIPPPHVDSSYLQWKDLARYSNRQKTQLKMGGLVGKVFLSEIQESWWPILVALSEIHLGKGTIMGLGKIRLTPIEE